METLPPLEFPLSPMSVGDVSASMASQPDSPMSPLDESLSHSSPATPSTPQLMSTKGMLASSHAAVAPIQPVTLAASLSTAPSSLAPSPSLLCSITKPLEALQQHFELQIAQMQLVEQSMKTHFNSTVPDMNPAVLLSKLRHFQNELPNLVSRHNKVQAEKAAIMTEVQAVVDTNQQLIQQLQSKLQLSSPSAVAASTSSSSLTSPKASTAAAATASPSPKGSPRLRASLAPTIMSKRPSTAPLAVLPPTTPEKSIAAANRRKSVRASMAPSSSVAPPSPSALVEASVLAAIQTASELEGPISEKEFAAVSTTVKSRVKLSDVNQMLNVIQTHFQRYVAAHKVKDVSQLPPLTLHTLAEEGGVKIGGASSQCIIGTLRACKRIFVGKNGILLVKPPMLK